VADVRRDGSGARADQRLAHEELSPLEAGPSRQDVDRAAGEPTIQHHASPPPFACDDDR
jgi:hypothetical protein